MTWDPTVSLGDVVIAGLATGVIPLMTWLARILIRIDRSQQQQGAILGSTQPERRGILGDLAYHADDISALKTDTRQHRDTLIEVTSELGLRRPGGRS